MEGRRTPQVVQYSDRRQEQKHFSDNSSDLTRRAIMYARTLQNIEKGETEFVVFVSSYLLGSALVLGQFRI